MRSLPLAPVFQCLFTFTLISTLCWLAEIWQLSRWGATRELNVEFKFQRRSCQLSFLFPPHRQSTPESLLAGCSEQGWETNLRIQTLAIFMLVRGECWGPHTGPPLSFLPHFLLMYFSHWTMIYRRPPAPSSSFTSLLQWLSILLWQLNLQQALAPRPHVSEYFSIRQFFFVDSKISKWICLFTRIQHVSVSTLVPRTPLGILATAHALWSVQNLHLGLWQNQPRN